MLSYAVRKTKPKISPGSQIKHEYGKNHLHYACSRNVSVPAISYSVLRVRYVPLGGCTLQVTIILLLLLRNEKMLRFKCFKSHHPMMLRFKAFFSCRHLNHLLFPFIIMINLHPSAVGHRPLQWHASELDLQLFVSLHMLKKITKFNCSITFC